MLSLSVRVITACCAPAVFTVTVEFVNADEGIGVKTYSEEITFGNSFNLEFTIPEGYESTLLKTLTCNDKVYDITKTFAEESLSSDDLEYATEKTITFGINEVTADFKIVFDMKDVNYKTFTLDIESSIMNTSKGSGKTPNIKALIVSPESVEDMKYFSEDMVLEELSFENNSITIEYGKYVMLHYLKPTDASSVEIPVMYADIHEVFTDSRVLAEESRIKFARYDVSRRGNIYNNIIGERGENPQSRLYYIGKMQYDISLYDNIPGFKEEVGFQLENNENKFAIITNMQDYRSELMSIDVYQATNLVFDENNPKLDKLDDLTIQKIDKYNADGTSLKNSNICYNIYQRYDVYNMYIGNNLAGDAFLTPDEKEGLTNELYVRIGSEVPMDKLKVYLLSYEKQRLNDGKYPVKEVTEFIESANGGYYVKIDKAFVEEFILDRASNIGGQTFDYQIGNAIFYVKINEQAYLDASEKFPYSRMDIRINDGLYNGYDSDYKVEMYIKDDNGNIVDYGYIDTNTYGSKDDVAYFRTDKLWNAYGDNQSFGFKRNLYIKVSGQPYTGKDTPAMSKIWIEMTRDGTTHSMTKNGQFDWMGIDDPKQMNGIEILYNIGGDKDTSYAGDRYTYSITVSTTPLSTKTGDVDFSYFDFSKLSSIYVTNSYNFDGVEDFTKVSQNTLLTVDGVEFGQSTNLYYFVQSFSPQKVDLYWGEYNDQTHIFEAKKDPSLMVSRSERLLDCAGNQVKVSLDGNEYDVYVLSRTCDVYDDRETMYFMFT